VVSEEMKAKEAVFVVLVLRYMTKCRAKTGKKHFLSPHLIFFNGQSPHIPPSFFNFAEKIMK
jgi:hypothetical protein